MMNNSITYLSVDEWQHRQDVHRRRVDTLTGHAQERRRSGKRHPVWDFMFSYYPISPGKMRHWHPGVGVALDIAGVDESVIPGNERFYRLLAQNSHHTHGSQDKDQWWTVDPHRVWSHWDQKIRQIHIILTRTAQATPQFGCFGLHEWAMVYQETPRHPEPLRLGTEETYNLVRNSSLCCTHFDAFRFFTSSARPRNKYQLRREDQAKIEQPGCLHASMDLYKWAHKLGPVIPGELWLDSFELACETRKIDMQASPYDLQEWGFEPIKIETKEGKAQYVRHQKNIMRRAQEIRHTMISILEQYFPDLVSSGAKEKEEN